MRNRFVFCVAAYIFFSSTCAEQAIAQTIAGGKRTEVLPNGIVLPEQWPPQTEDPLSAAPMRVPYLQHPPAVIPIHKGRQLFIDDFLIAETNLQRVFHQANKYTGNPVFFPETKEELSSRFDNSAVTYLGHGGVFFDPASNLFKMFYTAGWRGGLAMATSKDLVNWKRPDLQLAGGNIILPSGPLLAGGDNAIWLDVQTTDSTQRYKALIERLVDGGWEKNYTKKNESPTHTLHTSADGRTWSQGIEMGKAADYSSFFYNPFRNTWAFSIKRNTKRGRARYYAESAGFTKNVNWDSAVFWVGADSLDKPDEKVGDPAQLYSLNAVAYESILLGEFYIHLGPSNKISEEGRFPKITELKLGFSRDGFYWHRPDRRPFIPATRKEGDWDRAYLHGTTGVCLVMGDSLWFPYCGYSGIAPDGSRGMYTGASIGMATLRRDGFASMEANGKTGTLLTRPLVFSGKHLFVNVDCAAGVLKVEVLEESGKKFKGFSTADCVPVSANSTLQKVNWKGNADLSALAGKTVRFRFHLTNGKMYSFWVSPDENGASHGYIGAGGPGYDGVIDDKGAAAYEKARPSAPDSLPDAALQTPVLNKSPLPRYDYDKLDYGMNIGIERTNKGRIWACWVAGGDNEDAFFVLNFSDNNGKDWTAPKLVIDPHDITLTEKRRTLVGCLWKAPNGELWLFFDQGLSYFDGRSGVWYSVCRNPDADKPEWSSPVRIWHGATLNKPLVLSNGNWLLPVSLWDRGKIKSEHFKTAHPDLDSLRKALVFISEDQGKNWKMAGGVKFPDPQFDEHQFIEKKDGQIWMTARTANGIWESFSGDGGHTWSNPEKYMDHIGSRHFIRRLASGRLLLIRHGHIGERTRYRSKLMAFLSENEGKTWIGGLMIDERRGVSYPDGFQAPDGTIYISYDRNREMDGEMLLATFTEKDILAGKFVEQRSGSKQLISVPMGLDKLPPPSVRVDDSLPKQ